MGPRPGKTRDVQSLRVSAFEGRTWRLLSERPPQTPCLCGARDTQEGQAEPALYTPTLGADRGKRREPGRGGGPPSTLDLGRVACQRRLGV